MSLSVSLLSDISSREPTIYTIFFRKNLHLYLYSITYIKHICLTEILKRGWGALYVSHHDWSTKKILGSRWFEKAKIILETINF